VPRGRHVRPALPSVLYRVEGFDLVACSAFRLATENKDFAVESRCGNPASDARDRRANAPTIGCRIVFFMNPDAAIVITVDATCYRMKLFIDNSDGVMVSGVGIGA
jgi:hypothetical protein